MKIAIVYTFRDVAAVGIVNKLIYNNVSCIELSARDFQVEKYEKCILEGVEYALLGFNEEVLYLKHLDMLKDFDMIIVPSRHESESKIPCLTVHVTGNPWRRNDFGGDPMSLSLSNPVVMWLILQDLYIARKSYDKISKFYVSYEATHHGPTVKKVPILFVEIGSSENEWRDPIAQETISNAIRSSIKKYYSLGSSKPCKIAIGFGGSHYAPLFTKRALEKNECYGHMIPNYVIRELGINDLKFIAKMAIENTPQAEIVVIEKMRSELRNAIIDVTKQYGLEYIVI
ncbi:D-aminoacyl-tRNA deacylase [Ignisphaera sp. 4213-co]|uniref:D-aminoacyl-tRNA deacylase n=1 Tax=Ignisphaera cupida TaxID=3050454 RepID=A0ABD4Z5Z6_9CREN|nr:D-aminoacyl-tRNA deacylase [Ignisphaera sp. 4213-co]MDK6028363.1 D-aminoacyl-tRNA deacylase [Ignisphaera sp. 4213-co]